MKIIFDNPRIPTHANNPPIQPHSNIPINPLDESQDDPIKLSFNPKIVEVLKERGRQMKLGGAPGYLRHLIAIDIPNMKPYLYNPFNPERNKTVSIHMPAYMRKVLVRRADEAMCISETDYIRTLVYGNLILDGKMEFTLKADLEDNLL